MIRLKKITHELLPDLAAALEQDPDVDFAVLFGSRALGKVNPLSDVDIGVFLNAGAPPSRYLDKQLDLHGRLSEILRTNEIDLVLNDAPPELAFKGLRAGRELVVRNRLAYVRFRVRVTNEHIDRAPMRELYRQYLFRRIEEGCFGGGQPDRSGARGVPHS